MPSHAHAHGDGLAHSGGGTGEPSGVPNGEATAAAPATASACATPASTANDAPDTVRAFHVTTEANATLILQEGFRIPAQQDAVDRGLKAGAAAYFGTDPAYCLRHPTFMDPCTLEAKTPSVVEDMRRLRLGEERPATLEGALELLAAKDAEIVRLRKDVSDAQRMQQDEVREAGPVGSAVAAAKHVRATREQG